LKVIEDLHYHTIEDSKYISELKKALVESGIYDDENDYSEVELELKEKFKETDFYNKAVVFENEKKKNKYDKIQSFSDLGVSKTNISFKLYSGVGKVSMAFGDNDDQSETVSDSKDVKVVDIPLHIVKNALSKNIFFHFSNLIKYFKKLKSIKDFVENKKYLGGLGITFIGTAERIKTINNIDYFLALNVLLTTIEKEISGNLHEYYGTEDFKIITKISDKFTDVSLKINKNSERAKSHSEFIKDKEWYAYNDNFGTSEEKKFVEMFARRIEKIDKNYEQIYLIRNERQLKIYDKKGRGFEPDFVLFVKQKNDPNITYQMFIEPKGIYLKEHDKWKEDFLLELREKFKNKTVEYNSDNYKLTAVKFYSNKEENEFVKDFEYALFE